MPHMLMQHEIDPREALLASLGDISKIELFNNQVLVAIYVRPEKTKSGLYIPESNRDEDRFQSKIGLLLKAGPQAFHDPEGKWFDGQVFTEKEDWLIVRPSDGWALQINKVNCRIFDDISVRGRVPSPDYIW